MFNKVGLEDGTREKSVSLVTRREGTMGAPPVEVGEVRGGRGVKVVSGEWTNLGTGSEEGLGKEGGWGGS